MVFGKSSSLFDVNSVKVSTKDKLSKKRTKLDKEFKTDFYSAAKR